MYFLYCIHKFSIMIALILSTKYDIVINNALNKIETKYLSEFKLDGVLILNH